MVFAIAGVLGQAALAALVFTVPGLTVLERVPRARELPGAVRLACAFAISSLLCALIYRLGMELLPATGLQVLVWGLALACAATTLRRGPRRWLRSLLPTDWERATLAAGLLIAGLALCLLPLSPYPGLLTEELGDPPFYFSVAADAAAGHGWGQQSFWIGDYDQGRVGFLDNHPLPALITAFLFSLVGKNPHALFVFDTLSAALLLHLLASFMATGRDGRLRGTVGLGFVVAALVCLPGLFREVAFGGLGVPQALVLLTLASLWVCKSAAETPRAALAATLCVWLVTWRPEGLLLGLLALTAWGVAWLSTTPRLTGRGRGVAAAAIGLCALGLWIGLDDLGRAYPRGLKFASLFFVDLDADGAFHYVYDPWWELNARFFELNLSDQEALSVLPNHQIFEQIQDHPLAFARYVFEHVPRTAYTTAAALVGHETLGATASVVIVLGALALGATARGSRPAVGVCAAFLLLIPLANIAAAARHLLPVAVLALAVVGRACLLRMRPAAPPKRAAMIGLGIVVALLAGVQARHVARARQLPFNSLYVPLAEAIETHSEPDELVLSSYPHLVAFLTDRRTYGASSLGYLRKLVQRFEPDVIAVIDERSRDYSHHQILLRKARNPCPGYEVVLDDPTHRFLIYRRVPGPGR